MKYDSMLIGLENLKLKNPSHKLPLDVLQIAFMIRWETCIKDVISIFRAGHTGLDSITHFW